MNLRGSVPIEIGVVACLDLEGGHGRPDAGAVVGRRTRSGEEAVVNVDEMVCRSSGGGGSKQEPKQTRQQPYPVAPAP